MDQQLKQKVENKLPMKELEVKEMGKKIKQEVVNIFKTKVIGGFNSSKNGNEYIDKLKKEFKRKYEELEKKNLNITKEKVNQALE